MCDFPRPLPCPLCTAKNDSVQQVEEFLQLHKFQEHYAKQHLNKFHQYACSVCAEKFYSSLPILFHIKTCKNAEVLTKSPTTRDIYYHNAMNSAVIKFLRQSEQRKPLAEQPVVFDFMVPTNAPLAQNTMIKEEVTDDSYETFATPPCAGTQLNYRTEAFVTPVPPPPAFARPAALVAQANNGPLRSLLGCATKNGTEASGNGTEGQQRPCIGEDQRRAEVPSRRSAQDSTQNIPPKCPPPVSSMEATANIVVQGLPPRTPNRNFKGGVEMQDK